MAHAKGKEDTIRIAIGGTIGTGKSACINNLSEMLQSDPQIQLTTHSFYEPLSMWTTVRHHLDTTLFQFYKSDKQLDTPIAFQLKVLQSLIDREQKLLSHSGILLVERPLLDTIVFLETLHYYQRIPATIIYQLKELVYTLAHSFPSPDMTIILNADPNVALQRIKHRARRGEERLTLEYITHLQIIQRRNNLNHKGTHHIDTTHKTPQQVAKDILPLIYEKLKIENKEKELHTSP